MNINSLINILGEKDIKLRLYFTTKKNKKYISYSPQLNEEVQKKIVELIKKYLEENFQNTTQVSFSPIGYKEETIERCTIDYVTSYNDVISSYSDSNVSREPLSEAKINDLNFYCLIIKAENKEIKFFRRVTKFKKLSSSGILGLINGNKFNQIEGSLLGIDGNIDIVVDDNEFLILNHISLERIFSISEQYKEKAEETIQIMEQSNRIINFEQFKDDCLNDGRITRILTKLLMESGKLENSFKNFQNAINVINMFELNIEIDNSEDIPKIIYEDKDQLMDIIRIFRDAYYMSIINQKPGIDDSI